MKIAILAESFLPHMNGVTGSVLQVTKQMRARGHEILIVAPDAGEIDPARVDASLHGADTVLLRSFPFPKYPAVRITPATVRRLRRILDDFGAEVVHLASPFLLGWNGVQAAELLGIPTVAIYQTDVTAYAAKYGLGAVTNLTASLISRLHRRSTLTLTPSSSADHFLEGIGVDRLRRWGRGVDLERFSPSKRDLAWRERIAPGEVIIGYVGRLAPEKQVQDLAALSGLPGTRLVIVGDGPSRPALEQQLPDARFTGFLGGDDLARAIASFDVFVHTGEAETFCQTVQEAHASGVPVVATGAGGPLDLITNGIDGWLYRPGDLDDFRSRVADLTGDDAKRAAFAEAARRTVADRSWSALCDQLLDYYAEAEELRRADGPAKLRYGRPIPR